MADPTEIEKVRAESRRYVGALARLQLLTSSVGEQQASLLECLAAKDEGGVFALELVVASVEVLDDMRECLAELVTPLSAGCTTSDEDLRGVFTRLQELALLGDARAELEAANGDRLVLEAQDTREAERVRQADALAARIAVDLRARVRSLAHESKPLGVPDLLGTLDHYLSRFAREDIATILRDAVAHPGA